MDFLLNPIEHGAIAADAAARYGQTWADLEPHTRQRWMEAVKDAAVNVAAGGSGLTTADQAACAAIRSHLTRTTETVTDAANNPTDDQTAEETPKGKVVKAAAAKAKAKTKQ